MTTYLELESIAPRIKCHLHEDAYLVVSYTKTLDPLQSTQLMSNYRISEHNRRYTYDGKGRYICLHCGTYQTPFSFKGDLGGASSLLELMNTDERRVKPCPNCHRTLSSNKVSVVSHGQLIGYNQLAPLTLESTQGIRLPKGQSKEVDSLAQLGYQLNRHIVALEVNPLTLKIEPIKLNEQTHRRRYVVMNGEKPKARTVETGVLKTCAPKVVFYRPSGEEDLDIDWMEIVPPKPMDFLQTSGLFPLLSYAAKHCDFNASWHRHSFLNQIELFTRYWQTFPQLSVLAHDEDLVSLVHAFCQRYGPTEDTLHQLLSPGESVEAVLGISPDVLHELFNREVPPIVKHMVSLKQLCKIKPFTLADYQSLTENVTEEIFLARLSTLVRLQAIHPYPYGELINYLDRVWLSQGVEPRHAIELLFSYHQTTRKLGLTPILYPKHLKMSEACSQAEFRRRVPELFAAHLANQSTDWEFDEVEYALTRITSAEAFENICHILNPWGLGDFERHALTYGYEVYVLRDKVLNLPVFLLGWESVERHACITSMTPHQSPASVPGPSDLMKAWICSRAKAEGLTDFTLEESDDLTSDASIA